MKNIFIIIFISLSLFGSKLYQIPIYNTELSVENGGSLSAIESYKNGTGIYAIGIGERTINNSPLNQLVFKYGEESKSINQDLKSFVLNNSINSEDYSNALNLGQVSEKIQTIIGSPCNDNNSKTINDVYIDTIGTCQGTFVSYNCLDILNNGLSTGNGFYNVTRGTLTEQVYCNMTTDGGGWTLLYKQNLASYQNYYTQNINYIKNSTETMIGYIDSLYNISNGVKFNTISNWKNAFPITYGGIITPVSYKMLDGSNVSGTANLYYGYLNYATYCSDSFDISASWGKICLNYSNAPFFTGMTANQIKCNTANQAYNGTNCSSSRLFSIWVR